LSAHCLTVRDMDCLRCLSIKFGAESLFRTRYRSLRSSWSFWSWCCVFWLYTHRKPFFNSNQHLKFSNYPRQKKKKEQHTIIITITHQSPLTNLASSPDSSATLIIMWNWTFRGIWVSVGWRWLWSLSLSDEDCAGNCCRSWWEAGTSGCGAEFAGGLASRR
jgi:hypothetical protein